jgi:hypothetical protein
MPLRSPAIGETWRVLAYTLAIALGFIALERLQLALFSLPASARLLQRLGLLDSHPEAELQHEAAQVAAASRAALQRLPRGHRMAALRLGFELGSYSQLVGVVAMSPPEVQADARQRAHNHLRLALEQARQLGLGEANALGARSLRAFTELGRRYEADENGLAARVEDSGGRFALPPAALIRRHAALAGIETASWQPLTQEPLPGETPPQVVQRYRGALDALAADVAGQDARSGADGAN